MAVARRRLVLGGGNSEIIWGICAERRLPFFYGHSSRNTPCGYFMLAEPFGQILAVPYVHAKYNGFAASYMLPIDVNNQLITRRNDDRLFNVAPVVLHMVKSYTS